MLQGFKVECKWCGSTNVRVELYGEDTDFILFECRECEEEEITEGV